MNKRILVISDLHIPFHHKDSFTFLEEIKKEYKILKEIQNSSIKLIDKIENLFQSLKSINIKLWDIEDKLRIWERSHFLCVRLVHLYL